MTTSKRWHLSSIREAVSKVVSAFFADLCSLLRLVVAYRQLEADAIIRCVFFECAPQKARSKTTVNFVLENERDNVLTYVRFYCFCRHSSAVIVPVRPLTAESRQLALTEVVSLASAKESFLPGFRVFWFPVFELSLKYIYTTFAHAAAL